MKIILFDGQCHFCNQSVQFIMKRDKLKQFHFASLQGEMGKGLLNRFQIPTDMDSVVFIDHEQAYIKSMAALKIARHLDGFWKLFYVFTIVPSPIRNQIYDSIAKNRHKLKFKNNNHCKLPTKEEVERFL